MKAARSGGGGDEPDEPDIEVLLAELAAAEARRTAVSLVPLPAGARPSHRSNCSVSVLPSGEVLLFGGEFSDGAAVRVFNELYRCAAPRAGEKPLSGAWTLVCSPGTPPARCAHQACVVAGAGAGAGAGGALYLFGGEFATTLQFHHYSDTWKLDLGSSAWSRVESRRSPSARSGHRMLAWRGHLVLFGGFHASAGHDVWHRDLWTMDVRAGASEAAGHQWREAAQPAGAHLLHCCRHRQRRTLYGHVAREARARGALLRCARRGGREEGGLTRPPPLCGT